MLCVISHSLGMQAGSGERDHKLSRDCDNGHHSTDAVQGEVFLRSGWLMLVLDTVIENFNPEGQSLDRACLDDSFSKANCISLGFCARAGEAPLTLKG